MFKSQISRLLRITGLIFFSDRLHFIYQLLKNRKGNHEFQKENPGFILPPNYILYEAYQMDHTKYYQDGLNTAQWLSGHISQFKEMNNIKILDWGCGPARVLRHLPAILNESCSLFGTDYNKSTINWCRNNLNKINFSANELLPPLNYPDSEFDVVYGISIFTHLSEKMHAAWMNELTRILKPGGILLLTTQGAIFRTKLSFNETELFDNGNLVIRGRTKEGHRTFSAFQPEPFMKNLFRGYEVLNHVTGEMRNNKPQQDVWIVGKKQDN
jgi:ubiquinone/menaquinone biosynthesis C-methylase UbiE